MPPTGKRKNALSETTEDTRSPKKRFVENDNPDQDTETIEKRDDERTVEPEITSSSEPSEKSDEIPAPSKAQERMDRFKALQARAVSVLSFPSPLLLPALCDILDKLKEYKQNANHEIEKRYRT